MKQHPIMWIVVTMVIASCTSFSEEMRRHREHYKQQFLSDPRSPLDSGDLKSLDFFPSVRSARIEADFTATPTAEPFEMATYSGITRTYRKWGEATFLWKGQGASLALFENMTFRGNPMYRDYLFLPFKDDTNGHTTYGGGRYLNLSKADTEDGQITIDFNKSYNPWCAFSDGFNCPIPPRENHLPFEVKAGEKKYKGAVKSASGQQVP